MKFELSAVYNPLNEDFTFKWDGVEYTIPTQGYIQLERGVALHAGHKLAIHAMQLKYGAKGLSKRTEVRNMVDEIVKPVNLANAQQAVEVSTATPEVEEEAFEGLEDTIPVEDELKAMTKKELVVLGENLGIELDEKSKKEDLINTIIENS